MPTLSCEYWRRFWTAPSAARWLETASIAVSISEMSVLPVGVSAKYVLPIVWPSEIIAMLIVSLVAWRLRWALNASTLFWMRRDMRRSLLDDDGFVSRGNSLSPLPANGLIGGAPWWFSGPGRAFDVQSRRPPSDHLAYGTRA